MPARIRCFLTCSVALAPLNQDSPFAVLLSIILPHGAFRSNRASRIPPCIRLFGCSKGEAKKYWDELIEGKYEWSSIGKQLRRSINEGVRRHDAGHDLAEFFRTFFGIAVETTPLDEVEFPTFEEVLGILELAESEDESRPRKTSPEASPRRRGRASWSVRGRVGPSELALRKPDPSPPRCWRKAGALPVTKCHELYMKAIETS